MTGELVHDIGRQPKRAPRLLFEAPTLAHASQLGLQKMCEQTPQIIAPITKRRNINFITRQAMQKRFSKSPVLYGHGEIGVRSSDHAHIDPTARSSANRSNFAGFEGPQQHHLHVRWRVADFIEK